jgi:hypothetical protein
LKASRGIRYVNAWSYRPPDSVIFVCYDCAQRKDAIRRDKHTLTKTLCDICERIRGDVCHVSDYDFAEYQEPQTRLGKCKKKKDKSTEE